MKSHEKTIHENQKKHFFTKDSKDKRKGNGRKKGTTKAVVLAKKLGFIKENKNETERIVVEKIEEASKYLLEFITPQEVASRIASLAKIGDKDMLKIISEYYWGKPVQRITGGNDDIQPIQITFLPEKKETNEL